MTAARKDCFCKHYEPETTGYQFYQVPEHGSFIIEKPSIH